MERRILGKTGLSVSILTFSGIMCDQLEAKEAEHLVEEAIDHKINYFDVAPNYGNAQYVLGPALEPYRNYVYLACKTTERSAEGAKKELLESLSALKTDHFDNYQLHAVDKMEEIDQIFSPGGAMEVLEWAKKEGITKNIGFTSHHDDIAMELLRRGDFDTMLYPVNYAYRETKYASVDPLLFCMEHNIGVIAIKSMAERNWRPDEEVTYPRCWYRPIYDNPKLARIALNYTLTRPGVTTAPTPGDDRMFHLALSIIAGQNGKAVELTQEEFNILLRHAENLSTDDVIF